MRRKGTSFVALVALLASGFTFLEAPAPANAAIVTDNLVLNLDASNTSSMAATGATGWKSISPATSTDTGTFFGNPTRVSDSTGASMSMDGIGDGAVFPVGVGRTPGSMTVETWIKPGDLRIGWNIFASRWFGDTSRSNLDSAKDWHFGIYGTTSSNLKLQLNTGAGILTSNTTFPVTSANKWYHVAFTIDAANTNTATLWINGVADGTIANFPHTDSATAQLHVGDVGVENTTTLTGNMSRFRIYNAALNSSQMAQNYLNDSVNYGYAPANTAVPTFTGVAKVGRALTTNGGTWGAGDSAGTTTGYRWQTSTNGSNGWTDIAGATSASYTPVANDATNYLRLVITKTNAAGSGSATTESSPRVQTSGGTSLVSGGKLTGFTSTVPNDSNVYNVTLATNNLSATMLLGTTSGLTFVGGYASTTSYMATSLTNAAPIVSFRGTGTAINTALANVTYTSATKQVDVVKLYFSAGSLTATDPLNYIPIYDNGALTFHYYAFKNAASAKTWSGFQADLNALSTIDGVTTPNKWYLATPRYKVENDLLVSLVGATSFVILGGYVNAGSWAWYWPANTDGFASATTFTANTAGANPAASSTIFNGTSTVLPWQTSQPDSGNTTDRTLAYWYSTGPNGWDDTPSNNTATYWAAETYMTSPSGGTVLAQTVSVVASYADAPTGLTVAASGTGSIVASWNAATSNVTSSAIAGYRLEASTTSNFTSITAGVMGATATSGIVTGLAANTLYYVRIMATTVPGWGTPSSALTATTTATATTVTVVASGGGVAGADYVNVGGYIAAKSSTNVSVNAADVQTSLFSVSTFIAADNVVINGAISWSSSAGLALGNTNSSSVAINKSISSSGPSVILQISPASYSLDVKNGASISFAGTNPRLYINNVAFTLLTTEASLATVTTAGNFAIAKPLSLVNTYTASPIAISGYSGILDGLGNTVSGLKLNATSGGSGFVQSIAGGTIRNLGVTNITNTIGTTSGVGMGGVVGNSGGGTLDQVWSTGTIKATAGSTISALGVGGLLGNAYGGTTTISKSWSSVSIDTSAVSISNLIQGGIIGGDVSTYGAAQTTATAGGNVTLNQVYSVGNQKWAKTATTWHGVGGIMGLHFSSATLSMTDVFGWTNLAPNSDAYTYNFGGIIGVSQTGGSGTTSTFTRNYTSYPTCTAAGQNSVAYTCTASVVPGSTVSAMTGSTWTTNATSGTFLTNVAPPVKALLVQVVAPTDGSYAGLSTRLVDANGTAQTLSSLNLSTTGTVSYSIASNSARGTYPSVTYTSGLTLGGSAAGAYSLSSWSAGTSVTITRLPQTLTWAPTTAITYGSGSFSPSATPSSSAGSTISYAVTSAGTTGCTVNASTGVVTYTAAGSCEVTATAAQTTDYTAATVSKTFVIGEAAAAPTVTVTPATTNAIAVTWTTPNVNASTAITDYQILYSTSSNMSSPSTVSSSGTGNARLITGLTAGTTYYFQVRALGGSTWVGSLNTTPVSAAPKASATTITVVANGGGTLGTDYKISNGVIYTTNAAASVNVVDLESALASGNVTIAADNVVVNSAVSWSSNGTLTLGTTTGGSIEVNNTLTATGTSAGLVIAPTTYTLKVSTGAEIILSGASSTLSIGGILYTLIRSTGDLSLVTASGNFALAKPIAYSAGANALTAAPINVTFSGTFDGLGNTIDSMRISASVGGNYGLMARLTSGGAIRNFGLTNVNITMAGNSYLVGALVGNSTGGTIDQAWSTGFIRTTTTNASLALGGLVGNASAGTLNISKSWSSVNINSSTSGTSTTLEQGGIIGGDEATVGQPPSQTGAIVNLNQVYATGNLTWASNSHRGIGGLIGLHYNSSGAMTITDSFSWVTFGSGVPNLGNASGIIGISDGSSSTLTRAYQTTTAVCVTGLSSATPNCDTQRTAGSTVVGISGAAWVNNSSGTALTNLADPKKNLYVKVVAPTDGSFGTVTYQIVDGQGAVQSTAALNALNLSMTGTPTYNYEASVAVSASPYSFSYVSGLTLGGSSSGIYSLLPWVDNTSVTISKTAQTITWSPTTALTFGSGTVTPTAASASGGTTISYAVTSAGTTACSVNSSTGAITYTKGGSCEITATAANAGNYLSASTSATFVIEEPASAPAASATTAGNGVLNIGWTAPTVSSSVAITGYTLTYSTNSGMASPTTVNVGNTRGYLLTGLTSGTTYYFQVRAVSGSTWTGPLSAIASAAPNSTATTINVVASGGGAAGTDFKINGGVISATGTVNINASDIESVLATEGTVQLAATNVNVNAPISWSSNAVLVLGNTTAATVNVNSTVSGSGSTAGVKIIPSSYALSVKSGAYIRLTGATPSFNLGGTAYTVVNTVAGLSNIAAGTSAAITAPITLTTSYTTAVRDITFAGTMDGLGNTISNMQITVSATRDAGFFASLGGATVRNVGLINVNVSSATAAINTRLGSIAGNGSSTGTNTISQVWATGFINQSSSATSTKTEVGGLFGGATAGTLNITKSWSSVAISTRAPSVGSGGIIGTNVGSFGGGPNGANNLTITESYSTGNVLRDLTTADWYGNAGIIGVAYGNSVTITDVFTWGNINSTGIQVGTSTAGISGVGTATVTNAYTTYSSCGGTSSTCLVNQIAGSVVSGGTGYTTGLWQSVNGTSLVNLTPPTKNLYVRVVAPSNGSYAAISYEVVDSTGTIQTLSSLNLSVSGTPTYTIASNVARGTYSVAYSSGLTLGGTSANVYSLNAWITNTSVTITRLPQSITWAPVTAIPFKTGSFTPSTLATALGSPTITYAVTNSGTTGCSVNSTTGVVTYVNAGTCEVTATAAQSTDYTATFKVVSFEIASAPTFTIVTSGGGVSGTDYAVTSGVITATSDASINASDLQTLLASGAVQIAGSVVVNAPITWSANTVLTLGGTSGNAVAVNKKITASGNTAGVVIKPTSYGLATKDQASIVLSGTTPTLSIGGNSYTLIKNIAGLGSVTANSSDRFALAVPLTYSSTLTSSPINVNFAGTFDGLGNTVDNVKITMTGGGSLGFFKNLAGGTIRNLGITNLFVSLVPSADTDEVIAGGLVGESSGGTLEKVWSTGHLRSRNVATFRSVGLGGLVGNVNSGTLRISKSWSSVSMRTWDTSSTNQFLGGILGGDIASWAATSTTAGGNVIMNQVYFTGDLSSAQASGTYGIGGIQGVHLGSGSVTINDAFSWTAVSNGTGTYWGGVVGRANGGSTTYTNVYTSLSQSAPATAVVTRDNSKINALPGVIVDLGALTNWYDSPNGTTLIELPLPTKNIYVKVIEPTNGAFGTMSYVLASGANMHYTLSSMSLSVSGTPTYSINSSAVIGDYNVTYTSGLTLGGARAFLYNMYPYPFATAVSITKYAQTISVTSTAPTTAAVGTTYTLAGSASSGLTVTYSIDSGSASVCSLTGSVVKYNALGTCTINANQVGNTSYLAAAQVQQTTTVDAKGTQTVAFGTSAPSAKVNGTTYTPTISSTSGLTPVMTVDSGSNTVCSISSGVVSFLLAGDCVLNLNQSGDDNWNAATQVQQTVTVGKGDQSITFTSTAPTTAVVAGDSYTISATATSTAAVTFTIDAGSIAKCSVTGGVVTFQGAGTCKVLANQAGNVNWNAAPQTFQTFTVGKGNQTITFTSTAPTSAVVAGDSYTISATATSTAAVTFTIDAGSLAVCTVTSGVVAFQGAGTCKVLANQAGNTNWNAAPQNFQTFTVGKGTATLEFAAEPSSPKVGTTYTPAASSDGTGAVTFTIDASSEDFCSISEAGVVSFTAVGECKVNAAQATDDNWLAITQAQQIVNVIKGDQVITFTSIAPSAAKYNESGYTVTATGGASGEAVTFTVDSSSANYCSISGAEVTFTGVGACVINANQAGNENWNSAPQEQQSFSISKGIQTVEFTSVAPSSAVVGGNTYTPAATGTSSTTLVVFTIDELSAGICSITGGVVSFQSPGTCTINGNKVGDNLFDDADQAQQSFTVGKGSQSIVVTSVAPTNAVVGGDTYTATANGGNSTSPLEISIASSPVTACAIDSGVVSFLAAGDCVIEFRQTGDDNYEAASTQTQTITVGKGAQTVAFTSSAPTGVRVNDSGYLPTATGGASTSDVTIAVVAGSSEICELTGGEVFFVKAGTCVLNVNQAGDDNYNAAAEVTQTITVDKALQSITKTSTDPSSAVVAGESYTPTFTGGASGEAIVLTTASISSTECVVENGTVSFTGAGVCELVVNQAGNDNYEAAPEFAFTISVGKGSQAITWTTTAPVAAVVGGATYTPSAIGGATGNAVSFRVDINTASVCAMSMGVVRFVGVGTCTVLAHQAGNDNFLAAPQDSQTFTVGKGTQTITFTSTIPTAVVDGASYEPTATGGATGNEVTFEIAASSAGICELVFGKVVFQTVGDCVIEANQLGNTNYNAATQETQTITVGKGSQTVSFTSSAPAAKVSGTTYSPVVSGGASTEPVTISIAGSSSSICMVTNGVVSFQAVGSCVVQVNQDSDENYNAAPQVTQTITVTKGTQVVNFTSNPPSLRPVQGTTYVPTATSGNSGNPVVFSIDPAAAALCEITGGTISFLAVGDCILHADQAGNDNYTAATRVTQIFDITKGEQIVNFTSPAPITAVVDGATYTPTGTGGSGTKPIVFSATDESDGICSVIDGVVYFDAIGDCVVELSQASDNNYNAATPKFQTITVGKGAQVINFTSTFTTAVVDGGVYTPTYTDGESINAVQLSIADASALICEVNSGSVAFHAVGDCVIEARQAGDNNYEAAAMVSQTISVAQGSQATLVANSSLASLTLGASTPTAVLNTSGGSGTGAVTWSVTENSAAYCSVSGEVVSGLASGFCDLVATKAGDDNYLEATATLTIVVSTGGQSPVRTSVDNETPTFAAGLTLTLALSGGDGDGAVWFESLTSDVCNTDGGTTLTIYRAGTCNVIGHKDGDDNYDAVQDTLSFEIAKAAQAGVTINLASGLTYSADGAVTSALSLEGVLSSGSQNYSVTSGPCTIENGSLSATGAGACEVTATILGDDRYLEGTFTEVFTVAKAAQAVLSTSLATNAPPAVAWNGLNVTTLDVSGGSGTLELSVTSETPAICSVTITGTVITVTGLAVGTCNANVSNASSANYLGAGTLFSVEVLDLADAPTSVAVANAVRMPDNSLTSMVSWAAPSASATRAAVAGYRVQASTDNRATWTDVSESSIAADATSLSVTVAPWTKYNFRVAATSELDGENIDDAALNWAYFDLSGDDTPDQLAVGGGAVVLSTTKAATTSGETVFVTGVGFLDAGITSVEISTPTAVFAAGIRAAALVTTKTVPATVISDTKLSFVLPKITLPKGVTTLQATIKVLNEEELRSDPIPLDYIPKKLAQAITVTGLPATKSAITIGTAVPVGAVTSTGVTPEVTATPANVCTASIVDNQVTVVPVGRGTCTVTVQAPVTPAYTASAAKVYSYTVKGAAQTISFTNPGNQIWSAAPLTLVGAATLAPVFTSKTPTVCTVAGSTLTMVKAGVCTVIATQPGDSLTEPATPLGATTQTFTITKANRTPGLTATVSDILGGLSDPVHELSVATNIGLVAANVSIYLGDNPVDVPVRLSRAEGTIALTVDKADAARCSAEAPGDDPTLAFITVNDLGSCKVVVSLPADDRWNVGGETIIVWINAVVAPDGVNPTPTGFGDGAEAPAEFTDTTSSDKDSDPAVLYAQTGASVTASLGGDLSMAYDAVTGKYQFRSKTLLVGKYTAKMTGPVGTQWFAQASTITVCTKYSKGKCVKTIKQPTVIAVNECVATLTVKKDPKLKKRVLRIIGAGCQLNDAGKAAFNQTGVQNIIFKYQWIRQYPSTGLDHVKKGKTKVRFLKKVKRTVVIAVGRPAN